MNNESSQFNLVAPSKKLAITSLILGIVSLPTMGLLFIGGIVGLILGIQARRKAISTPEQYGGKEIALAGIITSILSLVIAIPFLIMAAIMFPGFIKSQQMARETSAIGVIRTIGAAQLQYSATKGRGKFTDLKTLAAEGLIDSQLGATGRRSGYIFECNPINVSGKTWSMYDVSAKPVKLWIFWAGTRSFYANETIVIYEAKGTVPPTATPQDRVPRNGTFIH